jgi:hypothetical protein
MDDFDDLRPPSAGAKEFGRLGVSVHGRVLFFTAHGPFDEDMMVAVERAIQLARRRLPQDGPFLDVYEFHGNADISPSAVKHAAAMVQGYLARGRNAYATVIVAAPDLPGRDQLEALLDLWRPWRPVHVCEDFDAAWAVVTAELQRSGFEAPLPSVRRR